MATYGPTTAGFVSKPLTTILEELDAALRGILGDSAGTEPDGSIPLRSAAGQLKVLIADREAAMWDLLQAVCASLDPSQATEAQLDALASLTGTVRNQASYSTVDVVCVGTNGTVLPSGRIVREVDTLAQFESTADGTINTLTAWAVSTAYDVGQLVRTSTTVPSRIYYCTVAGVSDGSLPPTDEDAAVIDGTVTWLFVAEGTAALVASCQAVESGPIGATAGSLTDIFTPVDGWTSAVNPLDAAAGSDVETDPTFRARRDAELAGQGGSTPSGILAAVSRVNSGSTDPLHQPPTAVKVFYNDTDYVDANGLPAHSVEVLVQGGTTADIAQAIFDAIGAGTASYGNTTSNIVDTEGRAQTVNWSRPVEVPIYVTAVVRYDSSAWPEGSEALVAEAAVSALCTYGDSYPISRDVRVSPLNGAIMRGPSEVDDSGTAVVPATTGSSAVEGLLEVESLYIGTSASPTTADQIAIGPREIATFDTSRTIITAATEAP